MSDRRSANRAPHVKKAAEYRMHAAECRRLASGTSANQLEQLLEMAVTWEQLAEVRSNLIQRHPELALDGEHREEVARPEGRPGLRDHHEH